MPADRMDGSKSPGGAIGGAATPRQSQAAASVSYAGDVAWNGLEEGFVKLSYIKAVELVDSYDLDIEVQYSVDT